MSTDTVWTEVVDEHGWHYLADLSRPRPYRGRMLVPARRQYDNGGFTKTATVEVDADRVTHVDGVTP